jgi:putative transposase
LAYLKDQYKMSHAQACKMVGCSRTRKYYEKRMPSKDAVIKKAIEDVIGSSRKGRTKVIKLVQKKHPELGDSKIRRVYEKEGFSLSRKLRRRIKDNPANPISIPLKPNQEWAMDFMSDALDNGRRIRTLNIIDHFNRQCKAIEVDFNLPARRVIEIVEQAIERNGKPLKIRTDNGPEFRSKRFQLWLHKNHIQWSRIQKGKPQQNAIIERFNKTYREDVLAANLFYSIEQANEVTAKWVVDYNQERPHQSLHYQTPMAYAA